MTEEAKHAEKAPTPSRSLHVWGGIGTAAWLVIIFIYVGFRFGDFAELELNEIGDFLAGVFAPLAFMWLVLGFFQQGQELRHSAEALWLQGRELQNSVEQQRELVNVTREQLAFESERLKEERDEQWRMSQPDLDITGGGYGQTGDDVRMSFNLVNHGRQCTKVRIGVADHGSPITRSVLSAGDEVTFRIDTKLTSKEDFTVTVTYLDELLREGKTTFRIVGVVPSMEILRFLPTRLS